MPFTTEQTFRDYLDVLFAKEAEASGTFAYRRLGGAFNEDFGIKSPSRIAGSDISTLLSSTSTLVIHEDPLAGLPVGQRVAYIGTENTFKILYHIPNEGNLGALSFKAFDNVDWGEGRTELLGKTVLGNIERISLLSDSKLKEWLAVVVELDKRSYAIDTKGLNNILIGEKGAGVYSIDVDDPRVLNKDGFLPSDQNILESIMMAIERDSMIKLYKSHSLATEYYTLMIEEAFNSLHERMTHISKEIGLPLDKEDYLVKNQDQEKIPRPDIPIILEEVSLDDPISVVASKLRFHHPHTTPRIR